MPENSLLNIGHSLLNRTHKTVYFICRPIGGKNKNGGQSVEDKRI